MEIIKKVTHIDFLGKRKAAIAGSAALIVISIAALAVRGLSFGIDFTGGTLVEVGYEDSVDVGGVRDQLEGAGFGDAMVQYFGTAKDIIVRLPVKEGETSAQLSTRLMEVLRTPYDEHLADEQSANAQQDCYLKSGALGSCKVQMRRVEFVGPQVGQELAEKGALAFLYAMIGILIYVAWRFEWRFAVGAVLALVHDVIITMGAFSVFQIQFDLTVLAALLAVSGYSLNDTIVVFDRIRENFRRMRKGQPVEIMNASINQTLPRTLLTSFTTMVVLLALLFLGGEIIFGFAFALIIGIFVGTYSSIFIASPAVLMLGLSREDLMPVKKEGAELDRMP
jgi:preprotein translocase subunit SecF